MEEKRRLRIISILWETDDAATFTLEPVDGNTLDYQPGQYLSFVFQTNSGEKRRAYSFSSSPGADALPAVTVKRVVNGEFSNYLLAHAKPGDILTAVGPHGRFLLPDKMPETIFYIVAGSGITPVFSHLKALLATKDTTMPRIILYYANRDSQNTIFKAWIDRWMTDFPDRFECLYFFSREKNADHALFRHLGNGLLEELLEQHFAGKIKRNTRQNTLFYLCAPKAIMRTAEMTLRLLDFPEEAIRKEIFVPEWNLPARPTDRTKIHSIVVHGKNERIEFQTFEGETILNAALRHGIPLPYSCKSGVCFSCLAKCKRGEVDVVFSDMTNREGPGQMINTCIGYAVTERVELEYE